ncbi:OsmC family protein [Bacillus sp. DJP31]|uniref:OsmC family protein n=1 Tax=Bacillus sp. DJP31 TaxID=3409789 RepID=UPI003BB66DB6
MSKKINYVARSKAIGISTKIEAKGHNYYLDEPTSVGGENKGPTPLHALLGALASCESITAFAAAKVMNIQVDELTFDINGELDPRGMKGDKEVKTYFEKRFCLYTN